VLIAIILVTIMSVVMQSFIMMFAGCCTDGRYAAYAECQYTDRCEAFCRVIVMLNVVAPMVIND